MTRKLEDLFASFSSLDIEGQLAHIQKVRSARHIERPVAAVKRVKKAAKQRDKNNTTARDLLLKLNPEQRAALIAKLKGGQSG